MEQSQQQFDRQATPSGADQGRLADWHQRDSASVLKALESDASGLTQTEAARRLAYYGANRLPEPAKRSAVLRFLAHFNNILIYVLLGSALITALLGHYADTGVILAVVIVNAIIGFVQEGKAEKALEAIRRMLALHASVIREGERTSVEGEQLVPGDIVFLEAGDKVPADIRLLEVHGLQVQEAILTGESLPVDKQTEAVALDAPLGDRSCLAFSGTLVTSGQGVGVVVATGAQTEIGRISGLLAEVEGLTTPLVAQMNRFARWLTVVILLLASALLLFGAFVGHFAFAELFIAVVGLSVAAIPEGLPAVLTITLAVGVQVMARRNAIVRSLPAIETLGSVSVICSDKTGTLTRNEMMAATAVTYDRCYTLDGVGYEPRGAIKEGGLTLSKSDPILAEMGLTSALCNDSMLHQVDGLWVVDGDPMEGALLALSGKAGVDFHQAQALWMRTDIIPFDAQHRYMATLNHNHKEAAYIFIKGAPEEVLAMCARQRTGESSSAALDLQYWQQQAETVAALGQRVLALAVKAVPPEHTVLELADMEDDIVLLGLVGLMDPPRAEAIDAIAECHRAGIRVKMITGDHKGTAAAIGRQIGLQNSATVLTGAEIDRLDDAALAAAVERTDLFARTSPEHKLRLVMALQENELTVAMTGDGVNDAPALKRADAGIAMGLKGSEAAKEAAELVLADDNFTSIVTAVREGRTVYDNIKKVISWTLPTNAGEAMTIIVALLFGMTLPITPIQILWVNLITAVTLGIALAFEPTESHTMQRPPRARNEPLLSGSLAWHIILVSTLFLCGVFGIYAYAIDQGYSLELARTLAVNTLVVMEIFHLLFIRNIHAATLTWDALRGTRMVWGTIAIVLLAQVAITFIPVLQVIFATVAISLLDCLLILSVGVALFVIIECEKQLRLRLWP